MYSISGMVLSSILLIVCLLVSGLMRNMCRFVIGFLFSSVNSSKLNIIVSISVISGEV